MFNTVNLVVVLSYALLSSVSFCVHQLISGAVASMFIAMAVTNDINLKYKYSFVGSLLVACTAIVMAGLFLLYGQLFSCEFSLISVKCRLTARVWINIGFQISVRTQAVRHRMFVRRRFCLGIHSFIFVCCLRRCIQFW